MASLASIENNTWGISTIGYGVVVQGISVIRQRLDIVIRTTKGSDPMRPEFGSNVYKYIDAPLDRAVPNIKSEIIDALEMWMPEIKVLSIAHSYNEPANPVFAITYRVLDDTIVDKLLFDISQGVTTPDGTAITEILLQAFFPANPNNYRYQIRFIRNSADVNPEPEVAGYATIADMFNWITTNWFFWGRWFLLSDRIVLYMNSEGVNNASLEIAVVQLVEISALFPPTGFELAFKVVFTIDSVPASPEMPEIFTNAGEVLFWAQENWADYGVWSLEGVPAIDNAVFSDEFSDEFDSPLPDTFRLKLVSGVIGSGGFLQITTVTVTE